MSKNIDKLIQNDLKKVKLEPMSDNTIEKYLKNPNIIEYKDLKNYKTIDNLLPKNDDYVIILYRHDTAAHWVALLRQHDRIEHFCSYASKPDEYYFDWCPMSVNLAHGQNEPYLSQLLNKCPYEVIYNPIQYQSEKGNIASCGRYACVRLLMMLTHDMNLNDYYNYLHRKKKEYNRSYDDLISIIINRLNND